MAKKNSKTSASRTIITTDTQVEHYGWIATNLYDPRDNSPNDIKKENLEEAKLLFHSGVNVVIPPLLNM